MALKSYKIVVRDDGQTCGVFICRADWSVKDLNKFIFKNTALLATDQRSLMVNKEYVDTEEDA